MTPSKPLAMPRRMTAPSAQSIEVHGDRHGCVIGHDPQAGDQRPQTIPRPVRVDLEHHR